MLNCKFILYKLSKCEVWWYGGFCLELFESLL